MLSDLRRGGAPDFRSVLEAKLSQKQSHLEATEAHLQRYVVPAPPKEAEAEAAGRFQNRLGPPVHAPSRRGGGGAWRGRLGPRVGGGGTPRAHPAHRAPHRGQVEAEEADEADEPGPQIKSVLSRVVIEPKTREAALKEQTQDTKEIQRNRRMFGNLLGTLQRFRQDETKIKAKVEKKREIEQKIDEKNEREKEEMKNKKRELFIEKKRQQHEIKVLQVQMKRVEQFEFWEKSKRSEMKSIRTSSAGKNPVYYLPKEHNDATMNKLEETMDLIESEIKDMRAKFEEDLLKIDEKLKDLSKDPEKEDWDDEEDEDDFKPKSQIASAVVVNDKKNGAHPDDEPSAPLESEVQPPIEAKPPIKAEPPIEAKPPVAAKPPVEAKPALKETEKSQKEPEKSQKEPEVEKPRLEIVARVKPTVEEEPPKKRQRYRSRSPTHIIKKEKSSPVPKSKSSLVPKKASHISKRRPSPSPLRPKKSGSSLKKSKEKSKRRRRRDSSSSSSSSESDTSDSSRSSYSESSSSSDSSKDGGRKQKKAKRRSSKKAVDLNKVKKEHVKIKQEVKQEKKE